MIGFAHRGAKAYAPENTLEAFALALRLGANGLESDVWLTADGVPVLDHDGVVRRGLRKLKIASLCRSELPRHIPSLGELLSSTATDVPLSLDIKDGTAFRSVIDVYSTAVGRVLGALYLCHTDLDVLRANVELATGAHLVHSTRLAAMKSGPERHAALLRDSGIDVVNMPYPDWSGGLVALFRRFEIKCFAWDCQHERQLEEVRRMGVDAVYSDWPDRLADVMQR